MRKTAAGCVAIAVLLGGCSSAAPTPAPGAPRPNDPAPLTTVSTATPTVALPTSCPTSSWQADTAGGFLSSLRSMGAGGQAIADHLEVLPLHPTSARGLLRAWFFMEPEAAERFVAFNRAAESLCGRPLVTDLDEVRAGVPTFAEGVLHQPDETFDACSGSTLLGWVGTVRVTRCGTQTVLIMDPEKRALRQYDLPQNSTLSRPGDAEPYALLAGDKIVWTNVIEHPASGLTQPTFDGTVSSIGLDLSQPKTVTAFSGIASDKTPGFHVQSASPRFVVAGPGSSTFYQNSANAPSVLLRAGDLQDAGKKLPAPTGDSQNEDPLITLLPLVSTEGNAGRSVLVTLDEPTERIISGVMVQEASAGCGQVGMGFLEGGDTNPKVYLVSTPKGTVGGEVADDFSVQPATANDRGAVFTDSYADYGLALRTWQGSRGWTISHDIAEFQRAVGVWLVVENKSGKRLVIDSRTGTEAKDLPAALSALLTDKERSIEGQLRSTDESKFLIEFSSQGARSVQFFDFASICPPIDSVPGGVAVGTGGVGTVLP